MAYTRSWNEDVPDGAEDKTFGDNRIREFKTDTRERLATEHADITSSAGLAELRHLAGRCAVLFYGTTAEIAALSSPPQYALAYNTTTKVFNYYTGSAWTAVYDVSIPSGTKMLFYQAAAPTGWTQYTSLDDKMLRVVQGAGAGTGGSWTVSGLSSSTVSNHSHSVGSHTHGPGTLATQTISSNDNFAGGSNPFPNLVNATLSIASGVTAASTGDTGAAGGHSHTISQDGTWRPAYADVIICTKD